MNTNEEAYYGELRALLDSQYYPGISYKNLQLDVDMNMMNKVLRLAQIKMSLVEDEVILKMHLKILDGEIVAAGATGQQKTGFQPVYGGL